MQQRRPKFRRSPAFLTSTNITACDLAILSAIERYKLLPASLLVRVVPFNEDVIHRHLRNLFDRELVNRFVLPRSVGPHGEFIYLLDDARAIDMLVHRGGVAEESIDREAVWRNREKSYADFLDPSKAQYRRGSLFYIDHELMISRFHAMLELACRKSEERVKLSSWQQGAQLWSRITLPRLVLDKSSQRWRTSDDMETLPHRPDAFFSLHFPGNPLGQQNAFFYYEADRNTTSAPETFRTKARVYFHEIVRNRGHRERHGIHRIRAVLIETLDSNRAQLLRVQAQHPTVCGNTPSPLFWFTTSELFTKKKEIAPGREVAQFLVRPELVLDKVWLPSSSTREFASLLD